MDNFNIYLVIKKYIKVNVCTFIILTCTAIYSTDSKAARVVAEKRECAICHIAWMSEFKRNDIVTLIPNNPRPIEKTGRQDVVSTERMCFSCHDGFVLDSRFLWNDGHNHPVGVKPSENVEIPKEEGKEIFPLNDAGNIYCGTCHSAHGIEWGDKLSPVFLRVRNINSSLCTMCHVDRKGKIDGKNNHPVEAELENQAAELLGMGSKFGPDNKVICQSCHRVHGAKDNSLLVTANNRSQLCTNCHVDKNNIKQKGDQEHFTHPVNIIPKRAVIPKQFTQADSKSGPNGEVICETCHKVHHASSDKLVLLENADVKDGICITCHKEKRGILNNGHNLFSSRKNDIKDIEVSTMLGVCGVCHNVHNGKGPRMWSKKPDSHRDRLAGLCFSCHNTGNLAEDILVGNYSHPVGTMLTNPAENIDMLPLFTRAGEHTSSLKSGLVSCPTCHDIHVPTSSEGSTKSLFSQDKEINDKYLRVGAGDRQKLCEKCHQDKWSVINTKHNLSKDSIVDKQNSLGVCGNCHQVHNGLGPRIWSKDNLPELANASSLCLSCHTKGGVAEDKTTGDHSHPIDVSIENLNIQSRKDVAGEQSEIALPLYNGKSRLVSCGTCHDPHRWTPDSSNPTTDQLDYTNEEGDSNTSFLRVSAYPNGQLCTTCHKSKETVVATDHDMTVTAPDTTNSSGASPKKSGICGQCHAVHNANQDLALWARLPGPGRDAPEMLCRSCHDEDAPAQEKNPAKAHHPSYVRAWSSELRKGIYPDIENIPMFSINGETAEVGYISCPTCHNAHQWSARTAERGSGINEEGDIFTSFLRLPSTENFICADCHGLDSIFRYKYFHGVGPGKPR